MRRRRLTLAAYELQQTGRKGIDVAMQYGNGVELEVYPSADTQNPDFTCEIWIAVKKSS